MMPPPSGWSVHYSPLDDSLYVSFGAPRAAFNERLTDRLMARFDLETDALVGFEIEDFERAFLSENPEVAASWDEAKRVLSVEELVSGDLVDHLAQTLRPILLRAIASAQKRPVAQN
jgi:hypothetical protein